MGLAGFVLDVFCDDLCYNVVFFIYQGELLT